MKWYNNLTKDEAIEAMKHCRSFTGDISHDPCKGCPLEACYAGANDCYEFIFDTLLDSLPEDPGSGSLRSALSQYLEYIDFMDNLPADIDDHWGEYSSGVMDQAYRYFVEEVR